MKSAFVAIPLIAAGVMTAGCAASSTGAPSGAGTTQSSSSAGAQGGSSSGSGASASSAAGTSGTASGSGGTAAQTGTTASGVPACTSADLKPSVGGGAGAGMSHNETGLQLTNTGSSPCTLYGYPGVSWVAGADGHQVGASATRQASANEPSEKVVTLRPGGLASAPLDITDGQAFPSSKCKLVPVRGLRIYPPGERAALYLPFPGNGGTEEACSLTDVSTLTIGYMQSGAQPGGGSQG